MSYDKEIEIERFDYIDFINQVIGAKRLDLFI